MDTLKAGNEKRSLVNKVKKKKRFFSKASKTRKKAEHKNGINFLTRTVTRMGQL